MSGENAPSVKDRDNMYRLIISQLFYDGYQSLAVNLASAVKAYPACSPSDRLLKVVQLGLREEEEHDLQNQKVTAQTINLPGRGLDLEFETDVTSISPDASQYETVYVTSHKQPTRIGRFHPAGRYIATGSADKSIKILDVDKILAKVVENDDEVSAEIHPVIRTIYDNTDEVTALDFHPTSPILAAGANDKTLKLFEYSRASSKKAQKNVLEAAEIKSLQFHPSGDYLLVGTAHQTVRLYDVNTLNCFVGSNPDDQHSGEVTDVNWSPNARNFVTCSKDGDIKIWDGVSNKVVCSFRGAHNSQEIVSVQFTRNGKYVLSAGMDSMVKLWELSTARCLIAYTGAGSTAAMTLKTNATFNHTEDYVLFPDEKTVSLCCWDSRNAERQPLLSLSHNAAVSCISHSPVRAAFITCSEDHRVRFWASKDALDRI